jgi:hypothetical protein
VIEKGHQRLSHPATLAAARTRLPQPAAHRDGPFPYRWRGTADYGPSKFGRYPDDPPSFTGRRVDLLGRSLPVPIDADPAAAVRAYLSTARTASARALAAKAVVLIDPQQLGGAIIWPGSIP